MYKWFSTKRVSTLTGPVSFWHATETLERSLCNRARVSFLYRRDSKSAPDVQDNLPARRIVCKDCSKILGKELTT